jgi:hypothetical protein
LYLQQKTSKSGVISVQIYNKSSGKYKHIKTNGSSSNKSEIERYVKESNEWKEQNRAETRAPG